MRDIFGYFLKHEKVAIYREKRICEGRRLYGFRNRYFIPAGMLHRPYHRSGSKARKN